MKLSEGDRVTTTYDRDRPGRIIRLGVEVSEVKFDDRYDTRFIPNELLRGAKK